MESEPRRTPLLIATGLAAGLVPIAAACQWWPDAVGEIFGQMLRTDAAAGRRFARAVQPLLWPGVGVALLGALWRPGANGGAGAGAPRWPGVLRLAAELALFRLLPPLPAFALYFCFWHTPEHLLASGADAAGRMVPGRLWALLRAGLWPWLVALGATLLGAWLGRHALASYAGTVFIALSALTVPHMVLAECLRRREGAGTPAGESPVWAAGGAA